MPAAEAMAGEAAGAMGGIDLLVCSPGGNNLPELLFRQPIAQVNRTLMEDLIQQSWSAIRQHFPDNPGAAGA